MAQLPAPSTTLLLGADRPARCRWLVAAAVAEAAAGLPVLYVCRRARFEAHFAETLEAAAADRQDADLARISVKYVASCDELRWLMSEVQLLAPRAVFVEDVDDDGLFDVLDDVVPFLALAADAAAMLPARVVVSSRVGPLDIARRHDIKRFATVVECEGPRR